MGCFRSADVRQLLHNKFVVILGDSIQRSVYKDLVMLLQDDKFLSEAQLKCKGEKCFAGDTLVEGGSLNEMHNGTTYREVRQYRTGHHLVRFYFLTRVYSTYLESILSDFQSGPQPDVLIVNSCIWDLRRYGDAKLEAYKTNLDNLFHRLKKVLSPQCLILWNMTMPVGYKEKELPEDLAHNLQWDIIEGNFFSATLADIHKLDVLDMHYHFRCDLRLRCRDAIHWNQLAHRKYTQILLTHIARAWGVEPPKGNTTEGSSVPTALPQSVALRKDPKLRPTLKKRASCHQGAEYMPGYTSFDGRDVNAMPGVPCLDYTNDMFLHLDAASSFVNDSPLLTANITPRFFTPHPPLPPPPPGPPFPSHPFAGRNLPPYMLPPENFHPLPHHLPYPQEVWDMKMMSRRTLRPEMGWTHPYPLPPMYPSRIY
ncbi:PC-esterase domain-containing protein 1A-like isoform X2 [Eleutherodactylus coqui]|uniref:PC-esterase domain-containing protein 1A-like isoform X2 n=1 Tax=Eleutherodactylus coqui TaxID=57060 RepID=UPI003462E2FC